MGKSGNILLTFVTEYQDHKIMADKLAGLLQNDLGENWEIVNIEIYNKFPNAYKIELKGTFIQMDLSELNILGIKLSDKIVSPWLIYYDGNENAIELIYNKGDYAQHRRLEFRVIRWGQLLIT